MKVLITGGAGFIGSELSHRLLRDGHEVTVIDNLSYGHESNLIKDGCKIENFYKLDVRTDKVDHLFQNKDCVFHFAAIAPLPDNQKNPQYSVQNNIEATVNVLELSRKNAVKHFIFASTGAVYENNEDKVLTEDLDVNPDLLYAVTKICSEKIVRSYSNCFGIPITILRFFNVYGPHQDFQRQHPPLMGYVVRELFFGRRPMLHSDGEQRRDYVHVEDVCDLCNKCMVNLDARGHTFNVCSGETASANEIFEICADQMKSNLTPTYKNAESLWDSYEELFTGNYPMKKERIKKETVKYSCGSYEKAKKILGWEPKVNLEEGIRKTIDEMLLFIKEN